MTIEQVTWELTKGVQAFAHLMDMLSEAASACKVTVAQKFAWSYAGLSLDNGKYGVTLGFNDAEKLWFFTNSLVDPKKAAYLQCGEVEQNKAGQCTWGRGLDLGSEEVHFFSRPKINQMRYLEEFLQDCLNKARSITISDQPISEKQGKG